MQTDALARNGRREGQGRVPQGVMQRMADRLEAPDASAFSWERETLTLPAVTLPAPDADAQVRSHHQFFHTSSLGGTVLCR